MKIKKIITLAFICLVSVMTLTTLTSCDLTSDKTETSASTETYSVKLYVGDSVMDFEKNVDNPIDLNDYKGDIDGYVFGGWYIDSSCTVKYDKDEVNEDVTLFAKLVNVADPTKKWAYNVKVEAPEADTPETPSTDNPSEPTGETDIDVAKLLSLQAMSDDIYVDMLDLSDDEYLYFGLNSDFTSMEGEKDAFAIYFNDSNFYEKISIDDNGQMKDIVAFHSDYSVTKRQIIDEELHSTFDADFGDVASLKMITNMILSSESATELMMTIMNSNGESEGGFTFEISTLPTTKEALEEYLKSSMSEEDLEGLKVFLDAITITNTDNLKSVVIDYDGALVEFKYSSGVFTLSCSVENIELYKFTCKNVLSTDANLIALQNILKDAPLYKDDDDVLVDEVNGVATVLNQDIELLDDEYIKLNYVYKSTDETVFYHDDGDYYGKYVSIVNDDAEGYGWGQANRSYGYTSVGSVSNYFDYNSGEHSEHFASLTSILTFMTNDILIRDDAEYSFDENSLVTIDLQTGTKINARLVDAEGNIVNLSAVLYEDNTLSGTLYNDNLSLGFDISYVSCLDTLLQEIIEAI